MEEIRHGSIVQLKLQTTDGIRSNYLMDKLNIYGVVIPHTDAHNLSKISVMWQPERTILNMSKDEVITLGPQLSPDNLEELIRNDTTYATKYGELKSKQQDSAADAGKGGGKKARKSRKSRKVRKSYKKYRKSRKVCKSRRRARR